MTLWLPVSFSKFQKNLKTLMYPLLLATSPQCGLIEVPSFTRIYLLRNVHLKPQLSPFWVLSQTLLFPLCNRANPLFIYSPDTESIKTYKGKVKMSIFVSIVYILLIGTPKNIIWLTWFYPYFSHVFTQGSLLPTPWLLLQLPKARLCLFFSFKSTYDFPIPYLLNPILPLYISVPPFSSCFNACRSLP